MADNSEEVSLLRWNSTTSASSQSQRGRSAVRISPLSDGSKLAVDLDFESDEEDELVKLERRSSGRKKVVGLWPLELAVLCVEHVQYSALLLALSLYWAFPLHYIQGLSFVFWINIDAWDFWAVSKEINNLTAPLDRVYRGARGSNLPSGDIALDYAWISRGWSIGVACCLLWTLTTWLVLRRLRRRFQHRTAMIFTVLSWLAILLALPALYASTRVFQCRTESINGTSRYVVDTINSVECNSLTRTVLIILSVLLVMIPLYGVLPLTMYGWIRSQLVSPSPKRHEAYLKLKEAEFGQGVSDSWLLGKWTLFAAFKRSAVYYHPVSFLWKFGVCIAVWFSHDQRPGWKTAQASVCVAVFGIWLLWSIVIWRGPFRVVALNIAHYISVLCLLLVSLLGAFVAADVETPLLRGELLQIYLIVINSVAVGLLLCVWIYLIVEWVRSRKGKGKGVWPALFSRTSRKDELDQTTSRYLLAMLRAQQCLQATKQIPPVLAPCHELARHIQIINAYCREAEQEEDQLHSSLWQVLDELTAMHSVLLRKSIFADSSKDSVRYCAQELHKLLPAWQKQLRQREKDFILMKPVKRRILLKLYVMSLFLSKSGQAEQRPSSMVQRSGNAGHKKKSAVRFADVPDVHSVSSADVADYLRSASQSTLGLADEDLAVHDAFLQQIDEILPEQRGRAFSAESTFSEDLSQPISSDLSEPQLDQAPSPQEDTPNVDPSPTGEQSGINLQTEDSAV